MKHYYEAYEDRYKAIHSLGHAWSSDRPTPIVGEILARYGVPKTARLLELGCGEGRDALPLLRLHSQVSVGHKGKTGFLGFQIQQGGGFFPLHFAALELGKIPHAHLLGRYRQADKRKEQNQAPVLHTLIFLRPGKYCPAC